MAYHKYPIVIIVFPSLSKSSYCLICPQYYRPSLCFSYATSKSEMILPTSAGPTALCYLAVQRREPPGKLHKDQKWTAPACVTITHFTSWFSPIQIGHYSVFHLAVPFFTASSGSLIQVLNRTIPQKPLNLLAFFDMSQLSHDPRASSTMSNTKSITAIQSTPQAIMYTAAVMTGTNWMTGIILRGRSLGIDPRSVQPI